MNDLFPKTQQLIFDFEEDRQSINFPDDDPMWEYSEDPWVIKQTDKIKNQFRKEYDSYNKKDIYFFGCRHSVYERNYPIRLEQFLKEDEEFKDISFVEHELEVEGVLKHNHKYLDQKLEKVIKSSLLSRFEFLREKASEAGYKLTNKKNDNYNLKPINTKSKEIEDSFPDLSGANRKQKVIYLKELGIIDFLRSCEPFSASTNSLASALSGITGIEKKTVQSYINPIINKGTSQKNNPYENKENVNKVIKNLDDMGFKNT